MRRREFLRAAPWLAPAVCSARAGETLEVVPGPVNGVIVNRAGRRLAIYGDPRPGPAAADEVLLTHFRRDVCWLARELQRQGARVTAPEKERKLIAETEPYWQWFEEARFHDYAMLASKVMSGPLPVQRTVRGGDRIEWQDLTIEVMDTPGYTAGSVTYCFAADGRRVACTGDLIYGDGQLLDLYSLQDAVPEAKLRGYHGYAARAGELVRSLRAVAAWKPDVLIPARGPVIERPAEAVERLIERLKAALREHFKTDALRWYFGDDNLRLRAKKLLEEEAPAWMPAAETVVKVLPNWLVPIRNARLLISQTRNAFLVDCGSDKVIEELKRRRAEAQFRRLEGIFITHYHDDHTDRAQACAEEFECPVYYSEELREILEDPRGHRAPCLSPSAIRSGKPLAHGARWRWREFTLRCFYFPGQTLWHDSLLVQKDRGETVFFVGDSFTPTGMDDYCLWNRNLLPPAPGLMDCLEQIRRLPSDHLLVNQHVEPAFRFSRAQLDFMEDSLRRRAEAMKPLFPWPGVNFGLDEQWARLSPYEIVAGAGRSFDVQAVIWNHGSRAEEFVIRLHLPAGWKADAQTYRASVPEWKQRRVAMRVTPDQDARGRFVVTADVEFAGWRLREWMEAIVKCMG